MRLFRPRVVFKFFNNSVDAIFGAGIVPYNMYTKDIILNGNSIKSVLAGYNIKPVYMKYSLDVGFYPFRKGTGEQTITLTFKKKQEAIISKIVITELIRK